MYEWETVQRCVQEVSVVFAVLLNSIFIFLVVGYSPKNIGAYKYLMISISIFELSYAILDVALLPIFHSFGSTFAIFFKMNSLFYKKTILEFFACLYCAFFGSSLAIFSIHFVYRFWAISGNPKLRTFNGWKLFLWLLIPIANGMHWSFLAWFACLPRKSTDDYLRNNVLETYDLKLEDVAYIAPYFYENDESGHVNIYYPSFVGIIVDSVSIVVSVFSAAFYAVKCHLHLQKLVEDATMSNRYKRIQSQLFYALVTQTLIPVILMHIPVGMMFVATFTGRDVGSLCGVVSITIALYPALDPIPTILIVNNYRKALCSCFCVKLTGRERSLASRSTTRKY